MTTDQGKQDKRQFCPIASATQFHSWNSRDPGVLLGGQLPCPTGGDRPISPEDTNPQGRHGSPKQGLSGAKVVISTDRHRPRSQP